MVRLLWCSSSAAPFWGKSLTSTSLCFFVVNSLATMVMETLTVLELPWLERYSTVNRRMMKPSIQTQIAKCSKTPIAFYFLSHSVWIDEKTLLQAMLSYFSIIILFQFSIISLSSSTIINIVCGTYLFLTTTLILPK